jgi:hypothetical protein
MAMIVVGFSYYNPSRTAGAVHGPDCPAPDSNGKSRLRIPIQSPYGAVHVESFSCPAYSSQPHARYSILQVLPGRHIVDRVEYDPTAVDAFARAGFETTRQRTRAAFTVEAGEIVYIGDFSLDSVRAETIFIRRRDSEARTAFARLGGTPGLLKFRPLIAL